MLHQQNISKLCYQLLLLCYLTFPGSKAASTTGKKLPIEEYALEKILMDASDIFGQYLISDRDSIWMSSYSNDTKLVHMNLPGTHDSATWNYSDATPKNLNYFTRLRGNIVAPSKFYRCQRISLISMLNTGIRVFDLRFAFDITKSSLVFWHAQALLSQTTTVEHIIYAFCKWLDDHPTETVLISLKYEGSTILFRKNNESIQNAIYKILTSEISQKCFYSTQNELGTLGEARGKIILLRRFSLKDLPKEFSDKIPGVYFPPSLWTRNGPDIKITYNQAKKYNAFIEDFYHINSNLSMSSSLKSVIDLKYNVTETHLLKATSGNYNELFWTFTSGEKNINFPPHYPKVIALGKSYHEGINQKLKRLFERHKNSGKRFGIVMFDFTDTPPDLIQSLLAVKPPQ